MARLTMQVTILLIGLLVSWSPLQAMSATTTNGIGLGLEAWDEQHGKGEITQSVSLIGPKVFSYENDRYFVGFQNEAVSFIEIGWEEVDGLKFSLAIKAVEELLPSDADLVESTVFPATAASPIEILVFRYESPALSDYFLKQPGTVSISVLLQLSGKRIQPDPLVARVSITVGYASD